MVGACGAAVKEITNAADAVYSYSVSAKLLPRETNLESEDSAEEREKSSVGETHCASQNSVQP